MKKAILFAFHLLCFLTLNAQSVAYTEPKLPLMHFICMKKDNKNFNLDAMDVSEDEKQIYLRYRKVRAKRLLMDIPLLGNLDCQKNGKDPAGRNVYTCKNDKDSVSLAYFPNGRESILSFTVESKNFRDALSETVFKKENLFLGESDEDVCIRNLTIDNK